MTVDALTREAARPATEVRSVFSLIVCTRGRRDTLPRLFDSLVQQSVRDFEVIVVDQNAPGFLDPILEPYRGRLALVHVHAAPGLSLARNVGLAHARGAFVALPDDDCWYEPDTLERVHGLMQRDPACAIVTGRTVDAGGTPSVSPTLAQPARISRRNYLECGNSNGMFFRRALFAEIGRFDERLGVGAPTGLHSGEEADMLLRALDAGFRAQYAPSVSVHHDQVDAEIGESQVGRAGRYGRGFGALMRKHRFSVFEVAYRVARPLAAAVLNLLRGRRMAARYKWEWAKGIIAGYRTWPRLDPRALPH